MPEKDTQATTLSTSGSLPKVFRLGRRTLLYLLGMTLVVLLALVLMQWIGPNLRQAGSPLRQAVALGGTTLLLVPLLFPVVKRSGLNQRPLTWFVAHVLASVAGLVMVCFHALGGQLLSPPGAVLALLLFLVLQGILARIFLSQSLSQQFATRIVSFHQDHTDRRAELATVIEQKRTLLTELDTNANEALFSPNLRHALRHPWMTLRYARLAGTEAKLVGARRKAGWLLSLWRRLHIVVAILFFLGVVTHVVVVTFFAGYAAAGRQIYWWHITAWGA